MWRWPATLAQMVMMVMGCSGTEPAPSPAGASQTAASQAAPSQAAPSSASQAAPASQPASAASLPADSTPSPPASTPSMQACTAGTFAAQLALPEASGAVWVEASFGLPAHLVVVSDSGNHGAFAVVDAATGAALASGRLPLEKKVSDDLEGLARAGGIYYALTSGGYMRHFRRTGAARFEVAVPAYPLVGATCDSPRRGNCGHDFEGLCLADPLRADGCAGFAASRRSGELVCLRAGAGGRLRPDLGQRILVSLPMTLSDCNIDGGGALYAVTNGFGGNSLMRVQGWRDPARARALPLAGHATGFIEAVAAVPGGGIVRLSDNGGPTSAMFLDSCPQAGPE